MTQAHGHALITRSTIMRRVHRLPKGSTPRVVQGQIVKAADTLAVSDVASEHRLIDLAGALGVEPEDVEALVTKEPGQRITEGDVLAVRPGFLGFGARQVEAPLKGRVISVEGGQMLVEGERVRVEVEASVPGRVITVEPESHVVVEAVCAVVQLAWARGGLSWGALKVMDHAPSLETDYNRFNIDHRGAVVVIGSPLTQAFLKGASDIRVKGVIGSSLPARLLPLLDNFDFPIGVTQGFGRLMMSGHILELLRAHDGREAVLDTGESSDWRERRPEIIIPLTSQQRELAQGRRAPDQPLATGQKVRVLQAPYLGQIGTIMGLPGEPRRLPSGLWAPGALVEVEAMEPGNSVFVPLANLEQLG